MPKEEQALGQKHSPGQMGEAGDRPHTRLERRPQHLHCRAQHRGTEMGQGRVGRARGSDDKGRGKEQSVLNSVAFQ